MGVHLIRWTNLGRNGKHDRGGQEVRWSRHGETDEKSRGEVHRVWDGEVKGDRGVKV